MDIGFKISVNGRMKIIFKIELVNCLAMTQLSFYYRTFSRCLQSSTYISCYICLIIISGLFNNVQSAKKKRNTLIYSNTNYRTEMKLVPIIIDYYLLQFDALKFFFGVRLHGGSLPNFNFFNVKPQVF